MMYQLICAYGWRWVSGGERGKEREGEGERSEALVLLANMTHPEEIGHRVCAILRHNLLLRSPPSHTQKCLPSLCFSSVYGLSHTAWQLRCSRMLAYGLALRGSNYVGLIFRLVCRSSCINHAQNFATTLYPETLETTSLCSDAVSSFCFCLYALGRRARRRE